MSGVGLPEATHLSLREGPDRRVCSPKLCRISGGSTEIYNDNIIYYLYVGMHILLIIFC